MTKLSDLFIKSRNENRAALIGYLPAGFPNQEMSIKIIKEMIDGGVDAIEIGFPYSDPVMDGPIIQEAAETARAAGITMKKTLEVVREVARTGAPTLMMTYWNPIDRYGVKRYAEDFHAAGMEGVITPDLTIEEASEWIILTDRLDMHPIFVVAPSTNDERLKAVADKCSGFVYAASSMGVTGARSSVSSAAKTLVDRLRKITDTPICVGLGVSNGDQAAEVAKYADGVIVGSAFVKGVLANPNDPLSAVRAIAQDLARGVRAR